MIDACIQGRLLTDPREHTARNRNAYVTAPLSVTDRKGLTLGVLAIAFDQDAGRTLAAGCQGDAVAIADMLRLGVDASEGKKTRLALRILAHRVLTAHHDQCTRGSLGQKIKAWAKERATICPSALRWRLGHRIGAACAKNGRAFFGRVGRGFGSSWAPRSVGISHCDRSPTGRIAKNAPQICISCMLRPNTSIFGPTKFGLPLGFGVKSRS